MKNMEKIYLAVEQSLFVFFLDGGFEFCLVLCKNEGPLISEFLIKQIRLGTNAVTGI